jgi:hypothetical protein
MDNEHGSRSRSRDAGGVVGTSKNYVCLLSSKFHISGSASEIRKIK